MIDAHTHLDMSKAAPIDDYIRYYINMRLNAAVLILLDEAEMRTYLNSEEQLADAGIRLHVAVTVNPRSPEIFFESASEFILRDVPFSIKIHPRRDKVTIEDADIIAQCIGKYQKQCNAVIVDNFFWGADNEYNIGCDLGIFLAKTFPKMRIVLAHFGGIKSLEVLMRTHELRNIYYDIAFSMNYLYRTSAWIDLGHCIRYSPNRVMIGSDYPQFTIADAFDSYTELVRNIDIKLPDDEVLESTAQDIYFAHG